MRRTKTDSEIIPFDGSGRYRAGAEKKCWDTFQSFDQRFRDIVSVPRGVVSNDSLYRLVGKRQVMTWCNAPWKLVVSQYEAL